MQFIGNKKVLDLLQRSVQNNSVAHAYLFSGPEKVGKFTLAKMFALHVIEGTNLQGDIDAVSKNAMLDLITVSPEVVEKNGVSKQRDISIESIREAKQNLSTYPYHGKYKVLIIDDAHKMNTAAQNGLLKILEEPNQTTVLILVTSEIDRMLPTILSRLQVINFNLVSDDDMRKGFIEIPAFPEEAIALSIGRPGLAKFLSEDFEALSFRADALKEFAALRRGSLNEKFKLAEELAKDIVRTLEKLNMWIWEIRKTADPNDLVGQQRIYEGIEKIQKSMVTLKRTNANARLILETLFMDL